MKVTICFNDTKIRVPCGNGDQKVSEIINNAILRYKKAALKPENTVINVYNLKIKRDGGILDPDDILNDVIEDEELLIAIYDEHLNHDSFSDLNNKSDIEFDYDDKIKSNLIKNNNYEMNTWTMPVKSSNHQIKETELFLPTENSYFNRGNLNRQSKANNETNYYQSKNVIQHSDEHTNENNDEKLIFKISNVSTNGPLGIHVIPTFDITNQKDMGLIIQQIETQGRIFKDGRFRIGDRIIEINKKSLIDVNFTAAQDILRDAMKDNELIFTIIRDNQEFDEQLNNNEQQFDQLEISNEQYNENGIEADNNYDHIQNQETSSFHEDDESPLFYQNNNSNKSNLNYLNTKKIGKKIHIQLIKGPQGLGFKLAARDNPTGEISPIYVKNILPKGAAIIDGRLQRGDRLLEVNGIDMTTKTLHETVNMLRNTKLGSLVDIVISRQLNAFPRELIINEQDIQQQNTDMFIYRELLTFEIPLNDTGSAGLGVSVKGKTKKHENTESNVDLGIFVKTVINGGAASKDGRLKPNDQLININGFSLLGKSNEEAMQILREAILVETLPGHIQLTVSRKRKQNLTTNDDGEIKNKPTIEVVKNEDKPNNKKEESNSNEPFNYNISENRFIKNDKAFQRNHGSLNFNEKRSFSRDTPTRRSMSEKRKQSSDVYAKVKINKISDKTKPQHNKNSNEILKNDTNGAFEKVSKSDYSKVNIQQNNNKNVYSISLKKSSSMESIPTADIDTNKKINNYYKNHVIYSNSNQEDNKNINSNELNYPLTNILNRQRTINRSFRTAVDKSFDVPISDISDESNFGLHTERMNHLRMSSQSDDMRKNKKTKKSLIETFQSFFKSNKKLNQEQKFPVELLTYNKNEDFLKTRGLNQQQNKALHLSRDIIKEKNTM